MKRKNKNSALSDLDFAEASRRRWVKIANAIELTAVNLFSRKFDQKILDKMSAVSEMMEKLILGSDSFPFGEWAKEWIKAINKANAIVEDAFKKHILKNFEFLEKQTPHGAFFLERVIRELTLTYLIAALALRQKQEVSNEEAVESVCKRFFKIEKKPSAWFSPLAVVYLEKIGRTGALKDKKKWQQLRAKVENVKKFATTTPKLSEKEVKELYSLSKRWY
ncbi:hypothetical protein HYY73_04130 [Candidatus Woesearchaeota archaeon]|nr:hypothetical protein [Candidatus Woesearchaeota archaeon]